MNESANQKKRRAWLAFLLSLFTPGLGQLYNGQWKKALLFYGVNVGLMLSTEILLGSFSGLLALIASGIIFYLVVLIDAIAQAFNLRTLSLRVYTRWYVYLFVILLNTFLSPYLLSSSYRPYRVAAGSMAPSLLSEERFLTQANYYRNKSLKRGDIVVFSYPDDLSRGFVKRVIGLPGETIEIIDKQVSINGRPLQEAYTQHVYPDILPARYSPRDNFGPLVIPSDSIFLLGDNRDSSLDSRFWKNTFAKIDTIQSKVLYIYWSRERSRIGRWVE